MSFRIIGGIFKNRLLSSPKGEKTRPTSAIVRKSVFDICKHSIENAAFLDLFAGSGAMGIEAISRGAKSATFVDQDRNAIHSITQTVKNLQIENQATILLSPVLPALKKLEEQKKCFTLVYIDPPYVSTVGVKKETLPSTVLQFLDQSSLLEKEAEVFLEEGYPSHLETEKLCLTRLQLKSTRKFGKSIIHHYVTSS